jgi:uncharacterized integral membrane protein
MKRQDSGAPGLPENVNYEFENRSMIRRIVSILVLVPLAIVFILFAVANREMVTLSLDPFDATRPAFTYRMPLFILIFVLLLVGTLVGGIAAWLRQSKWRRVVRQLRDENRLLRAELSAQQPAAGFRRSLPASLDAPSVAARPPVALIRS